MKRIEKWLKENLIDYIEKNGYLIMKLETNCFWVNGYGEKMFYDREYYIYKDSWNTYHLREVTGYNLDHRWCSTKHCDTLIKYMEKMKDKLPTKIDA